MQTFDKEPTMTDEAILYRMILPEHTCPFGVRAKALLEQHGLAVDDRVLTSREAVDAFEAEQQVETTPQIFIGGRRIGGCDALEAYLADQHADHLP
jgi:glutaredoxin 3